MKKNQIRLLTGLTVSASLLITCGSALPPQSNVLNKSLSTPASVANIINGATYDPTDSLYDGQTVRPGWEMPSQSKPAASKAPAATTVKATKTAETSVPLPYTKAWLDRYAPASVASFAEQTGDNGLYPDTVNRPVAGTYELVVDYTNQCVYAFKKDANGQRVLERVMICTTGGNGNWTPEGNYKMGEDYHRFGYFTSFDCYAQYWSQMWRSFYFHSILYKKQDVNTLTMSSYNNLGTPGSHGCIRLLVPDARWIYENCAPGTPCEVTTDYKKNPALKKALKEGYKGATDYKS